MKSSRVLIGFTLFLLIGVCRAATLESPDGGIQLRFDVRDSSNCKGCAMYMVNYRGEKLIGPSRLGFELADGAKLIQGLEIISEETTEKDQTWQPVYGERSTVRDAYKQLHVKLRQADSPFLLDITFRCYDRGVAFRYTIDRNDDAGEIEISAEKTQFQFLDDYDAWQVTTAQGVYEKKPLSQMWMDTERPLTVRVAEDVYVAVAEANLVDYARMKLSLAKAKPPCVQSSLGSAVKAPLPLVTPWRVIMIADSPGRLLEGNDIILNLAEPNEIADTSWIKPGKVLREVTLTTKGGKASVDFAAAHNMQYIMFDAGWYGPENDENSDATTVTLDIKRSTGPLDLQEVIDYAKQKGIGVILYVNHRALERQLEDILPLYKKWGVAGIKFGFVNVGTQEWTSWLHRAVRRAAEFQFMVDVHDEYRPTGYSRTYPNFMTQEGIGGDETSPTNEQTLNILFTRMLAGAGDNTICYFDSRVDENATHAYQLAKAVAMYSPWQFLYWYDRPAASPKKAGGAGGEMNVIKDEPELEFFDNVPTVWDDTKVLHGSIGEYAMVARRSGREWYIGAMNGPEARTLSARLDFLEVGAPYIAHIYFDDESAPTRTHVGIQRCGVTSDSSLDIQMKKNGGQAIRIAPAEDGEEYPPCTPGGMVE